MPAPVSKARIDRLAEKITTRLKRGCGEYQLRYDVEELQHFARWAAEVALQDAQRGQPQDVAVSPAPVVAAPGACDPPGAGAAPPIVSQAVTGPSEAVGQVQP